MPRLVLSLVIGSLVVGFTVTGCNKTPSAVDQPQKSDSTAVVSQTGEPSGLRVDQPVAYENLMLFPVCSVDARRADRFITLDEGLRDGTVEITETGAGAAASSVTDQSDNRDLASSSGSDFGHNAIANNVGWSQAQGLGNDVNRVLVTNNSGKPLYLMPGEIIYGGDQDRTIASELVIRSSGQPVPVEVFCVEHGRWGQREESQSIASLQRAVTDEIGLEAGQTEGDESQLQQAAEEANRGKFVAGVGVLTKDVRVAAMADQDQSKVWENVNSENRLGKAQNATDTFTFNYTQKQSIERLQPYLTHLQEPVSQTTNVVGVIVAINGQIHSLDVFESTPLFEKLWPKLLKSYALDAANRNEAAKSKVAKACTLSDAESFLHEAGSAQAADHHVADNVALTRRRNERLESFSAYEADSHAGGEVDQVGFGGGFGGAVHSAAFSK